jgi:hypothetical protein
MASATSYSKEAAMRKLAPALLLFVVLGSGGVAAACEQETLQTALETKHAQPFVHADAQRGANAPALIAWIAALSAGAVGIRRLRLSRASYAIRRPL